jgi:tetratricopeptide (TPR) repeat protein
MSRFLFILGLLFCAGAAVAQDGGQDSPLTGSQGVRALGMGGAVSAWLDEPAALWWNPATLSFTPVRRFELQYTRNAVDTRTEQFDLAFPTLDHGAWAVGGALQTTSDIIVTGPESPAPIGTESFDSFRLAAGYGFIAPYVGKLGATLNVAGYRFMGIQRAAWGLNVGAVPYASQTIYTGLVVQNLLQPTYSFSDGLEDKWPRRGVAAVAFKSYGAIISAQLELAQRQDTRFRVGAEYAPHEAIALRAGYDGDGPAFGVGLAFGRFRFDYAYLSPSDLGSEHRFGLSIDIGKPIELQRRLRDEQLDYEVSVALAQRQLQQREVLIGQADAAMAAGDWENGARYYAQLQLLFPDDPTYGERLDGIARQRDSAFAVRLDSATAQATDVERQAVLIAFMTDQVEAKQWQAALTTGRRATEAGADSVTVAELERLATDSLTAATTQALDRASSALAEGRATSAVGWARVALLNAPDDEQARRILRDAHRLGRIQQGEAALLEAAASGDTTAVLARVQDLLAIDPEHEMALQYMKRYAPAPAVAATTIDELKQDGEAWEWYTQGFVAFRAGNYAQAIEWWEKVAARYPTNEATQKNLEQARLRLEPGPSGEGE